MAFHDVRFPDSIAQGAIGGPGFSTSVITSSGGREQRQANWSGPRRSWDVSSGLKRIADRDALIAFFIARDGRAHTFRFKDWSDYTISRQAIGTTDGSDATWQAFKTYTSGPTSKTRTITKLVSGQVQVWVNGTSIDLGAGADEFQVNLLTGVITLGATLAATTGQSIELAGQFDVPVRFDTDELRLSMRSAFISEWQNIPIVEERE